MRSTARSSRDGGAWSTLEPRSSLYLSVFVGVVQSFQKFAYLNKFAPTGSEAPFAVTQLLVLILFVIVGVAVVRRYRPA